MLARIEHLNPKLNAYITVTAELALAQAKKPNRSFLRRAAEKAIATAAASAYPFR